MHSAGTILSEYRTLKSHETRYDVPDVGSDFFAGRRQPVPPYFVELLLHAHLFPSLLSTPLLALSFQLTPLLKEYHFHMHI